MYDRTVISLVSRETKIFLLFLEMVMIRLVNCGARLLQRPTVGDV